MSVDDSLIEYPCRFPIKIMGRSGTDLASSVRALIEGLLAHPEALEISTRASSSGTFVGVTATITATSREELDRVYRALSEHDDVLMVL